MLIVRAGQLIDGVGGLPRQNVNLVIDRGRIVELIENSHFEIPDGTEFYDASASTVLPGLIDAHTHLMWDGIPGDPLAGKEGLVTQLPGTLALTAAVNAKKDLLAGFTTIRDLLSYDFVDISVRDAINQGVIEGPRVLASGYGLTSTGGHMDARNGLRPDVTLGYFNNVVDTADQARIASRFLIKMGVDQIKINVGRAYRPKGRPVLIAPEMRRDVIEAICEEAHSAGRRVAAHSLGSAGELWAVQSGVDSLEHGHFLNDETLHLMAERGTYLVPTMTHCVRNTTALRKTLPQEEWAFNLILNAYDSMYRVIPKALQWGVRIAAGTDAGAENVPHGCNAMELELLTTIGMNSMQAILAATRVAAELLGMADRIGSLEKGRFADMLVVHGDPLQKIQLLQDPKNIRAVIKEGRIVYRQPPLVKENLTSLNTAPQPA